MSDSRVQSWLQRRGLLTVGMVILITLTLAAGGETLRVGLRYDRAAIEGGEYWRLVTGHLVHGSGQHVLVNLAGLMLMVALFQHTYRCRNWCLIVITSVAAIDLGFWFLMPQLEWYVGLSGLLHGVLAAGALAWWRREDARLALGLTCLIVVKLVWEHWHGALPLSGDLPVVVNAHLYGAAGGLLGGLLSWRGLVPLKLPTNNISAG